MIVTLHEELLRWRHKSNRISTETLRKGGSLLHALAVQVCNLLTFCTTYLSFRIAASAHLGLSGIKKATQLLNGYGMGSTQRLDDRHGD